MRFNFPLSHNIHDGEVKTQGRRFLIAIFAGNTLYHSKLAVSCWGGSEVIRCHYKSGEKEEEGEEKEEEEEAHKREGKGKERRRRKERFLNLETEECGVCTLLCDVHCTFVFLK